MKEIIQVEDEFYIAASSSLADDRSRVLKQGDTFAVFSRVGDIVSIGLSEQGVYHQGTRFLSSLTLRFGDVRPLLLSSSINRANTLFSIDLTNPDMDRESQPHLPKGSVHIVRSKFLWRGCCYERIKVRNFAQNTLSISLCIRFEADFADIFEVRGFRREKRGAMSPGEAEADRVAISYEGLDGVERTSRILFHPAPTRLQSNEACYALNLTPGAEETLTMTLGCQIDGAPVEILERDVAFDRYSDDVRVATEDASELSTSNDQFDMWLNRSLADLQMLQTQTDHGLYPYAGVPWFSTAFGRDGIITALETLWLNPDVARGVLAYLASKQADDFEPERDAQPGKILHETRKGELAALNEIPFARYYGSVDSTPLFVLLASRYYSRSGDLELIRGLWPNITRALRWMDDFGDIDGDGFLEYARTSHRGLINQGWKDSHDAIFHQDGRPAEGPIALCEVQGYAYGAKRGAAELAEALGHKDLCETLNRQADALREKFDEAFWSDELSTYALALDGEKRQCLVRSSNAGQCLFTGIANPNRIKAITETLMSEDSYSGWGIRTLAASEPHYNPMSYHNGSVWPHDNALIAYGLALSGEREQAVRIFDGLFEASINVDLHRMPELFCGFGKRPGEGPTLYPVACSPQAWSAAAVLQMLQACLGLSIDGTCHQIRFTHAILPNWLQSVRIRNLKIGPGEFLDLRLTRHPHDVGITVMGKIGDVDVSVVK